MGNWFSEPRDIELSTIKYLSDSISASWTGVTILKTFPQNTQAALPVVSIYMTETFPDYKEIGATTLLNDYQIVVDIFAKSDGQRIDLAYFILDKIRDPWTYYEVTHASGSETLIYTDSTKKIRTVEYVSNTKTDLVEDVNPYEKFRHTIVFNVRKL